MRSEFAQKDDSMIVVWLSGTASWRGDKNDKLYRISKRTKIAAVVHVFQTVGAHSTFFVASWVGGRDDTACYLLR